MDVYFEELKAKGNQGSLCKLVTGLKAATADLKTTILAFCKGHACAVAHSSLGTES